MDLLSNLCELETNPLSAMQICFSIFQTLGAIVKKYQTLFSKIAKTYTRLISDIFSLSFSGRRGRGDRDLRLAVDGRLVGHRHRHTAILTLCLLQGQLFIRDGVPTRMLILFLSEEIAKVNLVLT